MSGPKTPSFSEAIGEIDGGTLESQLSAAMAAIGLAVRACQESTTPGTLNLALKFSKQKGTGQVLVAHSLQYRHPADTGTKGWSGGGATGDTLMHVGRSGALSVAPEEQLSLNLATKPQRTGEPH
jgi:hypothetical protein